MTDLPVEGIPIQDPKKLDQKELLDRLQKATVEIGDIRRASAQRIQEAEQKSKADLDRLRSVTSDHTKGLRSENDALVKSLVRLQVDADALREENAILKGRLMSAQAAQVAAEERAKTVLFPGKKGVE